MKVSVKGEEVMPARERRWRGKRFCPFARLLVCPGDGRGGEAPVVDRFGGLMYSAGQGCWGISWRILSELLCGLKEIAARRRQRAACEGRRPLMAEGHPRM